MRVLLNTFTWAILALLAAAVVLWLLGIALKALSWVVRNATQIGRGR